MERRNSVNDELIEVTNKKLKHEAEKLKAEIKKSSMGMLFFAPSGL